MFLKFQSKGVDNIGAARLLLLEVCRQEVISALDKITSFRVLVQQALITEAQMTFVPTTYSGNNNAISF